MKRVRTKDLNAPSTARLDLGLSSLLNSFEPIPEYKPLDTPPTVNDNPFAPNFILVGEVTSDSPAMTDTVTVPVEKNEYEKLASEERWGELASLCEGRLSEAGKGSGADQARGYEARLWWIKSQLVCGGVPVSILAAPLDSVSEALVTTLNAGHSAAPSNRKLLEFCAQTLEQVAELLIQNREFGLGLTFLERAYRLGAPTGPALVRELEAEIGRIDDDPRKSRNPKLKERRAKLEQLLQEIRPHCNKTEPEGMPVPETAPDGPSSDRAYKVNFTKIVPTNIRGSVLSGAAFVVILFFAYAHWPLSSIFSVPDASVAYITQELSRTPSVLLPEMQRVSNVSSLDALFYDIDASRARADTQRTTSQVAMTGSNSTGSVELNDSAPRVRPAKAVVNTSSPIEGPEFQNLLSEPEERELNRSNALFGNSGESSPGRVQGMEVEKFDADKLYIVLTRTNVMARPSLQTASLAELQSGDKVLVEARVGHWLKLRSKQGQAGYILAQDAELGKPAK